MKLAKINIILTYANHPQEFMDIEVSKGITEEGYLRYVFDQLETNLVADLVKISSCQYADSHDKLLRCLKKTNGKFYFNPEVNTDKDTARHTEIKLKYLAERGS